MVDKDILWAKISAMEKHLERVRTRREVGLSEFLKDIDRQESVLFNLQMAVQNCIDLAAHIVSDEGLGTAGSTNELFYLLEEKGIIDPETTESMVKAVGFRNLIVHEYGKVDLAVVFRVSHENVDDLEKFAGMVSDHFG